MNNETLHIAPCGMNCSLCLAFQREKNKCPGCNGPDENKSKMCKICIIINCQELLRFETNFCYHCSKIPCKRLKQLDKRYRTKYGMSMIENLKFIENHGINSFIDREFKKWTCPECGSLFCVHRDRCQTCGHVNKKYPQKNEKGND